MKKLSSIGLTSLEKNRTNYPKIPLEYGIFLHFSLTCFSQFASTAVKHLLLGQTLRKTGELLESNWPYQQSKNCAPIAIEQQEGGAQVLQCPSVYLFVFVQRNTAQCSVELSRVAPVIA